MLTKSYELDLIFAIFSLLALSCVLYFLDISIFTVYQLLIVVIVRKSKEKKKFLKNVDNFQNIFNIIQKLKF